MAWWVYKVIFFYQSVKQSFHPVIIMGGFSHDSDEAHAYYDEVKILLFCLTRAPHTQATILGGQRSSQSQVIS